MFHVRIEKLTGARSNKGGQILANCLVFWRHGSKLYRWTLVKKIVHTQFKFKEIYIVRLLKVFAPSKSRQNVRELFKPSCYPGVVVSSAGESSHSM